MKRLLIALILLLIPVLVHAGTVTLAWDPNQESDLKGYKIYYGNAPGQPTKTIDVGNVTTTTITLADGTWYFAATAYDKSGNESGKSNEVFTTIDSVSPANPKALKITVTIMVTQ
jgi:hypothetical protein